MPRQHAGSRQHTPFWCGQKRGLLLSVQAPAPQHLRDLLRNCHHDGGLRLHDLGKAKKRPFPVSGDGRTPKRPSSLVSVHQYCQDHVQQQQHYKHNLGKRYVSANTPGAALMKIPGCISKITKTTTAQAEGRNTKAKSPLRPGPQFPSPPWAEILLKNADREWRFTRTEVARSCNREAQSHSPSSARKHVMHTPLQSVVSKMRGTMLKIDGTFEHCRHGNKDRFNRLGMLQPRVDPKSRNPQHLVQIRGSRKLPYKCKRRAGR